MPHVIKRPDTVYYVLLLNVPPEFPDVYYRLPDVRSCVNFYVVFKGGYHLNKRLLAMEFVTSSESQQSVNDSHCT